MIRKNSIAYSQRIIFHMLLPAAAHHAVKVATRNAKKLSQSSLKSWNLLKVRETNIFRRHKGIFDGILIETNYIHFKYTLRFRSGFSLDQLHTIRRRFGTWISDTRWKKRENKNRISFIYQGILCYIINIVLKVIYKTHLILSISIFSI